MGLDSNTTDDFDQPQVVLRGGTDNTKIGNVADSSKTALVGLVSTANSTTTPLGISGVFTGSFEDLVTQGITTVCIILKSDQASIASGLEVQWSSNGIDVDATDSFSLAASTGKLYSFGVAARYVRVKYTNDGVVQGFFRMQTLLHRGSIKTSSHRIGDAIIDDDDAELVKAVITGKAPSGVYKNLNVDEQGNLIVTALTGFNAAFTFGDVTTAATALAVIRKTAYIEQTTNAQRSIVSASALDTAAGTGARTVKITYLDSTGAGPYTETLTLNGVTPVNTVATNICFIEKIQVVTVGSTGSNAGIISLRAAAAGAGALIGTIAATDNLTRWAHHYVPTGKTCKITGFSVSHNGTTVGSGGVFSIKSIAIGVSNAVELQVSDDHRLYGQSSTIPRTYTSPVIIPGPARFICYVTPETASSTVYRASVDFFEPPT